MTKAFSLLYFTILSILFGFIDPASIAPTLVPSRTPSFLPTLNPSIRPSIEPTRTPSHNPSDVPSISPSFIPSDKPSLRPSVTPSLVPTSCIPSVKPSIIPSSGPTQYPSELPSARPSGAPSSVPVEQPSTSPTEIPSMEPTTPTQQPSSGPTSAPSTSAPSSSPSSLPSFEPSSVIPSSGPTSYPTTSILPSAEPTIYPTYQIDAWTNLTRANESTYSSRCSHSATFDGNSTTLYVIGGQSLVNQPTPLSDVWTLNILSNEWKLLNIPGDPFTARYGHSSVWSGVLQSVLTFGGLDGANYLSDIWQLNPSADQWTALYPYNSYPSPRAYHSAVYHPDTDMMYVVAGYSTATGVLSDVWSYDVVQNQWSKLTDGGFPGRYGHSSVLDREDNLIYTVAGYSTRALSDVWLFNLGNPTKPWSPVTVTGTLPARYYLQAVFDNYVDNMYVIGGLDSTGVALSDVWELKFTTLGTGTWIQQNVATDGFTGRFQHGTAVTSSGVTYTTGGALSTAGPTVNQTWALKIFSPSSKSPALVPTAFPTLLPSTTPTFLPTVVSSSIPSLVPSPVTQFTSTRAPSRSTVRPIGSAPPSGSIGAQQVTTANSSSQTVTIALAVVLPTLCLLILLGAFYRYSTNKKNSEPPTTKMSISASASGGYGVVGGGPDSSGKSNANSDVRYPFYKSPGSSHSSQNLENLQRQQSTSGNPSPPSRHAQMMKSIMAPFTGAPHSGVGASGVYETVTTTDVPYPTVPRISWNDVFILDYSGESILGHGTFGIVVRAVLKLTPANQNILNESDDGFQATSMDIAVKVFSHTSSILLGKEEQDEVLFQTAFAEAEIVINARDNMVFKENIIQVVGVAHGTLPLHLSDALRLHESTMTVGLIMKYEGGGSLNNLIHKRDKTIHKIPMVEKLRLLTSIARGLAELHTAGIIHGDVKPDNILLSSDELPTVKLADFGLSTIRNVSEVVNSTLDHTRSTRGTPTYCAPEMLVNPYDVSNDYQVAKASRSTDMYAFALVAYELLTEEKPFADVHKETLLAVKVHQGIRPPISKIPADCPPAIIKMIQSCWHGNRFMRDSAVTCYSNLNYEYGLLTNRIYDVYVSYHPNNRPAAELIFHRLSQLGCRVTFPNKTGAASVFSGTKSVDRVSLDSYSSAVIADGLSSQLVSPSPGRGASHMSIGYGSPTQSPNRHGLATSDLINQMNQHHHPHQPSQLYPLTPHALKQRASNLTISSETGPSEESEEQMRQDSLLQKSKIVIACLSTDYQSCAHCKAELRKAKHSGSTRVIIPLVIDPQFVVPEADGEIAYLCQLSSAETQIFDMKEAMQLERAKEMGCSRDSFDSHDDDMNTAYEFTPVLNEKIITLHTHVKNLLGQLHEKQKRPSFFKLRTESKDIVKEKSSPQHPT